MTVPESTSRFCARYPQWRAALTRRSAPRTQTPLSPPRLARGCLCGASMSAWRPTSVLSMPQGNDWSRKTHLMRRSGILCQRHWKSGCEYSPARLHAKHPSQPLLLFTARSVSAHVPPARVFQAHVPLRHTCPSGPRQKSRSVMNLIQARECCQHTCCYWRRQWRAG